MCGGPVGMCSRSCQLPPVVSSTVHMLRQRLRSLHRGVYTPDTLLATTRKRPAAPREHCQWSKADSAHHTSACSLERNNCCCFMNALRETHRVLLCTSVASPFAPSPERSLLSAMNSLAKRRSASRLIPSTKRSTNSCTPAAS